MASTIKLKNGSGAPTTGDLVQGEPALDLTNKRLYTENASGVVIEVGTNPSTIDINAGTIDGTVIGGSTPAAVTTSSLVATTADINAGTIDGTVIGGSTAAAGSFTSLTASGDVNFDSNTLFVDASANAVGIGTSSPTASVPLTIVSDSGNAIAQNIRGRSDGIGVLLFSDNSDVENGRIDFRTNYAEIKQTRNAPLIFSTNNTERLRIDSSGNVGIGTSSTNGLKTAILGATGYPATSGTTQTGVLRISGGTGLYNVLDMGVNESTDTAWMQATRANNLGTYDNLVINPYGGSVGIGTSSPNSYAGQTTLNINSAGVARLDLDIGDTMQGFLLAESGYTGLFTPSGSNYLVFGTNNTERMRIDSSGNLLVGTTTNLIWNTTNLTGCIIGGNASSGGFSSIQVSRANDLTLLLNRLSSDGQIQAFARQGTQVGEITVTTSATSYNTSSDYRLKENIADADDAGSKIDAIKVRKFDWKADGSHQDYGMVAQELMTVAPEAVSGDPESDEMMGVDYSKLVPMMLKEIQSLRARVAQLEGAN